MGRRDVGRGRRLRPVERIHRAREARKLIRGCLAYWDHPRLIRPPRTTAGPPSRLEADREKAGRGRKLDRRQVRNGDPTADKSGGFRPIERRTFRSDPDAGSKGEARKGGAGANRGDAERLKN